MNVRGSASALAFAVATVSQAVFAQVTAAPPVVPAPGVVVVPQVQAVPPVPILPVPVVLPEITPAQAELLATWLGDVAAQGLARDNKGAKTASDDRELVLAALDRARAIHTGRLGLADFLEVWALRPAAYDPLPRFTEAVARDRVAAWIASQAPPYAGYDGLRRGLSNYRAIETAGGWRTLEAGPSLAMGSQGPRVLALRKRLAVEDKSVTASGSTFDAELRDAVRRAQRRYGLNPTGALGTQTLAALNISVGDRVRSIMANMERWRWLPPELPTHRIQVNIAAAVLTVFEGDRPVQSMRAVTGRPGDETPMLTSRIHSIVVNPPWNVPQGIAARELWPKERARKGYFAANGFKVIPLPEGGNRLQQAAGTQSALGRLKFDFDNPFAVYLHDTPLQAKFASYDRLASHGCVRLERPVDLAELVLKADPKWAAGAVQTAIDAGKTVRVPLPEQVSVYLLYWTAFASANGQINFRDDPYKWDSVLASKIEASTKAAEIKMASLETGR